MSDIQKLIDIVCLPAWRDLDLYNKREMKNQAASDLARITAENIALRKALKLSAEMFHGSALAYGGSIHDAGKFTDCNNGYCLEAAAQLKKTS